MTALKICFLISGVPFFTRYYDHVPNPCAGLSIFHASVILDCVTCSVRAPVLSTQSRYAPVLIALGSWPSVLSFQDLHYHVGFGPGKGPALRYFDTISALAWMQGGLCAWILDCLSRIVRTSLPSLEFAHDYHSIVHLVADHVQLNTWPRTDRCRGRTLRITAFVLCAATSSPISS